MDIRAKYEEEVQTEKKRTQEKERRMSMSYLSVSYRKTLDHVIIEYFQHRLRDLTVLIRNGADFVALVCA